MCYQAIVVTQTEGAPLTWSNIIVGLSNVIQGASETNTKYVEQREEKTP